MDPDAHYPADDPRRCLDVVELVEEETLPTPYLPLVPDVPDAGGYENHDAVGRSAPTIVGTVGFAANKRDAACIELRRLYLQPDQRGRGLGVRLFERRLRAVMALEPTKIITTVATPLAANLHLHATHGFKLTDPTTAGRNQGDKICVWTPAGVGAGAGAGGAGVGTGAGTSLGSGQSSAAPAVGSDSGLDSGLDSSSSAPGAELLYYFAIGSMINPVSFRARGLTATVCKPAELMRHRIAFRGRSGMASVEDVVPAEGKDTDMGAKEREGKGKGGGDGHGNGNGSGNGNGNGNGDGKDADTGMNQDAGERERSGDIFDPSRSVHGVVWLCDEADMAKLDAIESSYDRVAARARLYDGVEVDCTVYKYNEVRLAEYNSKKKKKEKEEEEEGDGLPSERYLEIMIEGCRHHNVSPSYVEWLRAHGKIARRDEKLWASYPDAPAGVTMSMEELATYDGKGGARLCYGFNGKVCEVPDGCPVHPMHGIAGGEVIWAVERERGAALCGLWAVWVGEVLVVGFRGE